MAFHWDPTEQVRIARFLFKWTLLGAVVGILGGCASAVFLISLDYATTTRLDHPWLLYLLPLCGVVVGLLYHWAGKDCDRGNNLILEEIHNPRAGVSGRMAPLILVATVATHLCGGSAGREGTAVQMGGSMAGWLARKLRLDRFHTRLLLMAGISAGCSSIFGTPLAGTVFGLEVLAIGQMRYDALIPCLVAAVVGNWTCNAFGVVRTPYLDYITSSPELDAMLVAKVLLASLVFALVSVLFAETTHLLQWLGQRWIAWAPGRPLAGGVAVIVLVWLAGSEDYLGLGIPILLQSFTTEGVATWAFFWKVVFTAVTLGSGFKGGEVTPLFFIGAALGSTLGTVLGVPHDFMAALGFVAVFAAAANTPLACTLMGIELFGMRHGMFLAIACCSAYIWSGHRGIYLSQLVGTPKTDDHAADVESSLGNARRRQPILTHSLRLLGQWALGRGKTAGEAEPHEIRAEPPVACESGSMHSMHVHLAKNRSPGGGWLAALFSRPLHLEIIDLAHAAGLKATIVEGTNLSNAGAENNGRAMICIELVGERSRLEAFLQQITA